MNKRHYYTVEDVLYPANVPYVRVRCYENLESRHWISVKHHREASYVGSTNRYVVRAIKLHKLGQEWPIDVSKD